ncbi:MAG: neutral/alkaline non-lysosomal ceramidase N-terminal domain-containing protein [Clostridia bacterium]|nr:neutral/alkaline non-lysosomal ceramidase N-terminal domain-containing protein [Clostridia bacterium]
MKKTITAIIAVLLCLCIIMPTAAFAQSTNEVSYNSVEEYVALANEETVDESLQTKIFFAKLLNKISNFFINSVLANVLNAIIPDSAAVADYEKFDINKYDNFYAGMDKFIDEPQGDKVWSLGYGKASVLPADFGTKKYAKGAYIPYIFGNSMYKDEDGIEEDLMVRTVVMDDGSGRGKVVFIALDAMGFANADVRLVREGLKEIAKKHNIVSINVSCTHIHTGIDSQGVWTDPIGCIINNIFSKNVRYGVERSFIDAVVKGSKKAVEEALAEMTQGKLYYSKTDVEDYVFDRTAPIALDPYLYKLEFVPFAENATPTIIATYGCHPESASYDWASADPEKTLSFDTKFSPDFIWHAEKVINAAGYNFIFIQGNVSTVTSGRGLTGDGIDDFPGNAHYTAVRYGYEIGYIILGMSMTTEERIALNEATGDRLDVAIYANQPDYPDYTIWYEGRETVEAVEVKPVLNIKHKQFTVRIDNNIITLLGKTSVADNFVLKDDMGRHYTVSEVGYLEIGENMKVYMSPGETFGELFLGGSGAQGFELKPIREYTGEDIIVMDLMNDAAGYVANPANYVLAGLQYNEFSGEFDSDTWCLISYGKGAAPAFIGSFYEIYDSVR